MSLKKIQDGLLRCTQTSLKSMVLPTLSGQFTFHNRLLRPTSKGEESLQIASYILRKWRFQAADTLAYYWHSFGHSRATKNPLKGSAIYRLGNRLLTRRSADEYFFKSIPQRTENMEFIYPSSCDPQKMQQQIQSWLAGNTSNCVAKFFFDLMFPTCLYNSL